MTSRKKCPQMQEQGKRAADVGSGSLPAECSPQPWKGSDFKWHPVARLISRQSHCHLSKTIIIEQSFASAHVSKTHFTDITVQVSCVLLRTDSFEKDSSVTCKSQFWLSQEKLNRRTKEKTSHKQTSLQHSSQLVLQTDGPAPQA